MLLVPVCLFADSSPLSDFRIEVRLTNTSEAHTSIPIRCLAGCDWEEMIIECSEGESVCHAMIEARIHSDAPVDRPMEVRPISGTVCLGTGTTSLEAAVSMGLRTRSGSSNERGPVIAQVAEGSPAKLAGFEAGDLVTSFNGVPVQEGGEILNAIHSMVAGQQFAATLDRNGTFVEARGSLGMRTTANTCVPTDARLLRTPSITPEELEPTSFKLVMDAPQWRVTATCFRGCAWNESGFGGRDGPHHHQPIVVDQNELRPAMPGEQ